MCSSDLCRQGGPGERRSPGSAAKIYHRSGRVSDEDNPVQPTPVILRIHPSKPAASGPRPRPAIFRALGRSEPPPVVQIEGAAFRMIELLKHDSWAATAIYESADRKALCKFNRQQSILGLPMRWLGRLLASRERAFHARLDGIPGIAPALGTVTAAEIGRAHV